MPLISFLILLLMTTFVYSFPCIATLAKDNCWINYDVTVTINDSNNNLLATVIVPKGQAWVRESFNCSPGQQLSYQATFNPVFWQENKGQSYQSTKYWVLPATIGSTDKAWEIPICFPQAFSAVPFPPEGNNHCACNFTVIPPLKN